MSKTEKTKKPLSAFEVLGKMVEQGKDVRAFHHILGIELKGKKGQKYSELKMQIDEETHQEIAEMMFASPWAKRKKTVVLYVFDVEQFDEINNQ